MSILQTVRAVMQSSSSATATDESKGAYWCHDCGERTPDPGATGEPPTCPSCGEAMTFERSPGSTGCAC